MELQARKDPVESAEASWTLHRQGSNERSAPPGASFALPARGVRGAARHARRSRGHRPAWGEFAPARATLETLPGPRQADRGVTRRCPRVPGPAGVGTQGRPVGSGHPAPRNSLQDGRGLWSRVGTRRWHGRCGDLGYPRGEARGRLMFRADSGISLGNGSIEPLPQQASLGAGSLTPFLPCSRPQGLLRPARGTVDRTGQDRMPGGHLQRQSRLSPLEDTYRIVVCPRILKSLGANCGTPGQAPLALSLSCGRGESSQIRLARTE